MAQKTKIAIVGAGMNGLALAIALCKMGFLSTEISIYEKGDSARAEGTGIIFWAETIAMLKVIGVDLTGIGVPLPKLKSLFALDNNSTFEYNHPEVPPGQENYGFLRKDLYNLLLAQAKSYGLYIQTGFKCIQVTQDKDECMITFTGKDPVKADIVIACDGINSLIRKALFPTVEPESLNIRAYRGIYVARNEDVAARKLPNNSCDIHCNPNARIVIFPVSSIAEETTYYWFAAHRINGSELSSYANKQIITNAEIDALIARIQFCPENLKTIFKETPHEQIMRSATLRQSESLKCDYGRIALLGDSVHSMAPTGGLGFLLGIVNILYLAGNLRRYANNMPLAIDKYSNSVATHSKECLAYNMQLTNLFYVESPKETATESAKIYGELFQLITAAASKSISFYSDVYYALHEKN